MMLSRGASLVRHRAVALCRAALWAEEVVVGARAGTGRPTFAHAGRSFATAVSEPTSESEDEEDDDAVTFTDAADQTNFAPAHTWQAEYAKQMNPYAAKLPYDREFLTEEMNPLNHTYEHVGKYFSLGGTPEDFKKKFPAGVGRLQKEFDRTHRNLLQIRPVGVLLKAHLEHWRQTHGRALAATGAPVLDIQPDKAYTPPALLLPMPLQGASKTALPTITSRVTAAVPRTDRYLSLTQQALEGGKVRMIAGGVTATGTGAIESGASPSSTAASGGAGATPAPLPAHPSDPYAVPFSPVRLLTGPPGVGKSAVLAYLVSYARSNGWLSLYVPDSWSVMNEARVLVPSKIRPGFIDTHDIAMGIIRATLSGQAHMLARIPQRGKYQRYRYLPKRLDSEAVREKARRLKEEEEEKNILKAKAAAAGGAFNEKEYKSRALDESDTGIDRTGFTLRDMLEWGVAHPTQATDTLLAFMAELRQVTEYPVLIALDGWNLLYEKTDYPFQGDGHMCWPEEVSVNAAFHALGEDGFRADSFGMKRGVYVGSVTQLHGDRYRMFQVSDVKDKYRVRVPELTRRELFTQLMWYANSKSFLFLDDPHHIDGVAVEYYRALTASIPAQVFEAATYQPGHSGTRGMAVVDPTAKKKKTPRVHKRKEEMQ